jgi:hypothetical protein
MAGCEIVMSILGTIQSVTSQRKSYEETILPMFTAFWSRDRVPRLRLDPRAVRVPIGST